ncbi:hypothetical protein [Novosphingobium sp. TH158]|uniref:hypothetical protein n=1 Tax=Novosphingobium sp. TH158 TaxID=2067455 RepID=UPI0011819964|nr:hypothetical protein [Novosphingobium sp. TH158]
MNKLLVAASVMAVSIVASPAHSGPIEKFDRRIPEVELVTSKPIFDIERCLIKLEDTDGFPVVYGQPDKPNQRMIVWFKEDTDGTARVDLLGLGDGKTAVKSWKVNRENKEGFDNCVGS